MKNNPLAALAFRTSIRARMLWTFLGSFLLAFAGEALFTQALYLSDVYNSIPFRPPIAFLGVFIGAYMYLSRHFVRYLRGLADGLASIAGGNLSYRVPQLRDDELGLIARNINRMAERLEAQIEKERKSEASKMELITGVSHDLRTPLTSIIGYVELLAAKSYRDEAEYERFVGNAYTKAIQLKKLIDDLFEYTRLTGGSATLRIDRVDLRELLRQLTIEFQPLARDRGLEVELNGPEEPVFVPIDSEKVTRAIDNLLMNALKYSVRPGRIGVSLATADGRAVVAVENDGDPIGKEQEERLFERFYKADVSRSGRADDGGSGLGLSIAASIVELHGGRIELDHRSGHFIFRIRLPM